MTKTVFDGRYYARYYADPRTRVADAEYYARLARFISAYAGFLDLRIESILDLGCGIGALCEPLLAALPGCRYSGVEISEYACARHGWTHCSIASYRADPHNLVICHDVLQYLDGREASAALANFDSLCDGLLYFSVLTREDWRDNCDQSRTDGNVYQRSARWYRQRLKPAFRNLGGGMYLSRRSNGVVYALEHLD